MCCHRFVHSISPLVYADYPGLDSPYSEFIVGRRPFVGMQAPASCVVKVCWEQCLVDEDNNYVHECFK